MSEPTLDLPRKRSEALRLGIRYYATGRPCPLGHLGTRLARNGQCVMCEDDRRKSAAYREWQRRYRTENREYLNKQKRQYHEANKPAILAYKKKYHIENRAAGVARVNAWRKSNPEAAREHKTARRYRAQAGEPGGAVTARDLRRILKAQRGRCAACASDLQKLGRHLDHIEPLARGGRHAPANLQYLCPPCNMSKSARDPIEFMQSLGRLL
jgi:5-methylcytosine-specific restriction endonuclease McrA